MSNRFIDNETPLNAATLNQFEEDMVNMIEQNQAILSPASETTLGGIKIWVSGTTLYIKTIE